MFLKAIWKYWKNFAHFLAKIQTTIILALVYYLVLSPIGIFKKTFSFESKKRKSYWINIPEQKNDLEESYRQY